MTPAEEHQLYEQDRAAWARYIAPRWADMLRAADDAEKRRLWGIAGPELRAELTALAQSRVAA
jgi:hypothetical protein